MVSYKRAKLALDVLRSFRSKTIPKTPIQKPTNSDTTHSGSSILAANWASFSSPISRTAVSQFLGQQARNHGHFHGRAKRSYYVDRHNVQHFRRGWVHNPRAVLTVILVGSGVAITVYNGNLGTVPYTKRRHFVLLSKPMERKLGETQFEQMMKAAFKGKILPAIHPVSIRVRLIANDVVTALQRGLSHERVWSDMGYASSGEESFGTPHEEAAAARKTLIALKETDREERWLREDEILDDKWVQDSRKKGQQRGSQPETSHLEGLDWEVLVVNEPVVNAFCLPGGKIVVFT